MDKQSFSKLSKLAESGDTKALFKLGKMCLFGRYVNDLYIPQDKVKGFRLIQQAAALGYTQAQSYLEQRWKECGKMLEPHECPSCGGKGFIKHFWLFDRPCSRCRASGRIYHCPECESHWRSMFNFRVDELREAMSDAGSTPGRPAENPRLSGESTRDPKAARLVEKAKAGKVGFRLNVGAMKFVRKGSLCPTCGSTGRATTYGIMAPCPTCKPQEHARWRSTHLPPPLGHPWWQWTGRR